MQIALSEMAPKVTPVWNILAGAGSREPGAGRQASGSGSVNEGTSPPRAPAVGAPPQRPQGHGLRIAEAGPMSRTEPVAPVPEPGFEFDQPVTW